MPKLEKCHDCGVEPGQYHGPGCDVETCAACKGQKISCDCEGTDVLVPYGFEPTKQNDLWLEFESGPIKHELVDFTFTVCGLCGNSGRINIEKIRSPRGVEVRGAQGYCICPNGRIMKAKFV